MEDLSLWLFEEHKNLCRELRVALRNQPDDPVVLSITPDAWIEPPTHAYCFTMAFLAHLFDLDDRRYLSGPHDQSRHGQQMVLDDFLGRLHGRVRKLGTPLRKINSGSADLFTGAPTAFDIKDLMPPFLHYYAAFWGVDVPNNFVDAAEFAHWHTRKMTDAPHLVYVLSLAWWRGYEHIMPERRGRSLDEFFKIPTALSVYIRTMRIWIAHFIMIMSRLQDQMIETRR